MSRSYKVTIPGKAFGGYPVDIFDIPNDFDDLVRKSFFEYTKGTRADFTYQDKLAFIDIVVADLNKARDAETVVDELVIGQFKHEWKENGEVMTEDDIYCAEFMQTCYETGRDNASLYSHFGSDDHHVYDELMRLLVRIITVVMNYEPWEDSEG